MAWRVTTPDAQTGSTIVLSGGNASSYKTVAQLEIQSDAKEAIPCTIYFGVDTGQAFSLVTGEKIQWKITWGYGGAQFEELWEGNAGQITKVGCYFRVSAAITPVAGSSSVAGSSAASVRAMCVPATPAERRRATFFVTPTPGANGNLSPPLFGGPAGTNPNTPTSAVTLLRLFGWNYGTTAAYLMLMDGTLANGASPRVVAGYVPVNGTFSLDVSPEGIPFSKFCDWAASSTGDVLTNVATALFNLTAELYLRDAS